MKYPIIILGAGASHDYSPHIKGAPLTQELVSDEFLNPPALDKYKDAANLIGEISPRVSKNEESLEQVLQDVLSTGELNYRKTQRVDLEFYLKELFDDISKKTHPINNYAILNSKITALAEGKAHIATFNYDTLFERAVGFIKPPYEMNIYLNGNLRLIKLHGSHDWIYFEHPENAKRHANGRSFYRGNPDFPDYVHNMNLSPYHEMSLQGKGMFEFPALAVPISGKKFICPANHVTELKSVLQKTDRILIIGWRAGDPELLDIFHKNIKSPVKITIVAGGMSLAHEVEKNIKQNDNFSFQPTNHTFSSFLASKDCDNFFQN